MPSTITPGMPYPMARSAKSLQRYCMFDGVEYAQRLLSTISTSPKFCTAAKLMPS